MKETARRGTRLTSESALGRWVRERRTVRRMSQKDLAVQARISRSYMCDIEHGRGTQPSLQVLQSIARALGEDPAELFMQAGFDIDRSLDLAPGSQRERRVVTIFRALSPESQEQLERFARFLHGDEQQFSQPQLIPFKARARTKSQPPERTLLPD